MILVGSSRVKKKKMKKLEFERSQVSTDEILAGLDIGGDDIVRLKVTVRKGARIESVPLNKLEKVASKQKRYWKFENGWLMLYGAS